MFEEPIVICYKGKDCEGRTFTEREIYTLWRKDPAKSNHC